MLSQEMPFGNVQKGQFYCCAEVEVLNGHWWKGDTGPGWLHREKTRSGFDQTRGRCLSDYLTVAAAQLGGWIVICQLYHLLQEGCCRYTRPMKNWGPAHIRGDMCGMSTVAMGELTSSPQTGKSVRKSTGGDDCRLLFHWHASRVQIKILNLNT